MNRRGLFVLTAFLLATIGCGDPDRSLVKPPTNAATRPPANEQPSHRGSQPALSAPSSYDGRDYLPLKSGKVMWYQVRWSPPLGESRSASATSTLSGDVNLAGKDYFKQITKISGIPFSPATTVYYRSAPEGVYQLLEGDEERPEWLYLPRTITIGDTWRATTSQGELEFEAAGIEDVETPSGDYHDCLKLLLTINGTLAKATEEQWLAPGVGFVKQVDRNPLFSSTTLLEEITQDGHPGH